MTVRLDASSLASKFGFNDGDILDDVLWAAYGETLFGVEENEEEHLRFDHEVLARLVEQHLLPLLPPTPTMRIGTIHNPIRVETDTDAADVSASAVYIEVEDQTVVAMAEAVAAERGLHLERMAAK